MSVGSGGGKLMGVLDGLGGWHGVLSQNDPLTFPYVLKEAIVKRAASGEIWEPEGAAPSDVQRNVNMRFASEQGLSETRAALAQLVRAAVEDVRREYRSEVVDAEDMAASLMGCATAVSLALVRSGVIYSLNIGFSGALVFRGDDLAYTSDNLFDLVYSSSLLFGNSDPMSLVSTADEQGKLFSSDGEDVARDDLKASVVEAPVESGDAYIGFNELDGINLDKESDLVGTFSVAPDDVLLLASDGLFRNVFIDEIHDIYNAEKHNLHRFGTRIIDLAHSRGDPTCLDDTPYSKSAQISGFHQMGGIDDDISIQIHRLE